MGVDLSEWELKKNRLQRFLPCQREAHGESEVVGSGGVAAR